MTKKPQFFARKIAPFIDDEAPDSVVKAINLSDNNTVSL